MGGGITNGAAFALFGNGGLEYPAHATSFPVASGVGFATAAGAVAMNGQLCETCGRIARGTTRGRKDEAERWRAQRRHGSNGGLAEGKGCGRMKGMMQEERKR